MEDKIIIMFHYHNKSVDIEVPVGITANELIFGLNSGFNLGLNMENPQECYFRAENPIALVRGEKTLEELGLRNGSSVYYNCWNIGEEYGNNYARHRRKEQNRK